MYKRQIKNKAIEQLKAGKPLLGKDGAFAPLLESILNAALEGEMDAHLKMCIRDRYSSNGGNKEHIEVITDEVTRIKKNIDIIHDSHTVSYTHLDVYKRQGFLLTYFLFCMRRQV